MRFLILSIPLFFLGVNSGAQRPGIGILSYEEGLQQGREACGLWYLKINPYSVSEPKDFPVPPYRAEPITGRAHIVILGGDDGLARGKMECSQALHSFSLNPKAQLACVMSLEIEDSYPIGSAAGNSSASAAANTVKNCCSSEDIKTCFGNWVSCFRRN